MMTVPFTVTTYRAFGLTLHAQIALPELIMVPDRTTADVTIAMVEALPPPRATLSRLTDRVFADATEFRLAMPGVAQLRVCDGVRIEIHVEPGHDPAELRAHLLGSAFGALLLQRGLLPLHASAVDLDGRAIAFTGMSGAGKSTLALALQRRGHAVLCDDLCALAPDAPLSPGVVRLKLWDASLAYAGADATGLERIAPGQDKFHFPPPAPAIDRSVPLGAIVLLAWGDDVALTPLHGAAAVQALVRNTYRGVLVEPMGIAPAHLARCVALARQVPVFTLTRPRAFAALDAVIAALPSMIA